jgi:hypothetical protein
METRMKLMCWLFAFGVLSTAVVPAAAQTPSRRVSVEGAAGTDLRDAGQDGAGSIGFQITDRVQVFAGAERIHWPTKVEGVGATRGGTATFASAGLRVFFRGADRVSPYVIAGAGRGLSKPNVNDLFPDPVTNDSWLMFGGGGVRVPVTPQLAAFADLRAGLVSERDTIRLILPVRGGVEWRF